MQGVRKLIGVATVAAILPLAAWNSGCQKKEETAQKPAKPAPVEVDAVVLSPAPLSKTTEVNGSVIAAEYAELRPEVSGRLVYLDVREGAFVEQHKVIAKLNADDLQATLKRQKAEHDLAKANLERISKLLEVDGINRQEFDQANAQLAAAAANMEFTQAQIDKTIVKAPFSGVLGLRNVSNGAYITPQNTICTIQQTGTLKVDFNVPENLASLVKQGDSITVQIQGQGQTHRAIVSAIEPQLQQSTRNLKVRAILPSRPGIAPGAFAKVRLDAGSSKEALLLPTQAIVPDTRFKKVFVIKGGKAESVVVETGYRTENSVEIISGLQKGDTVAVTGVLYLRPGADAKVRSILKSEEGK